MIQQQKTQRFVPDREIFAPELEDQVPHADALSALHRHLCGDLGELAACWRTENEKALKTCDGTSSNSHEELNSIYVASNGVNFCITAFLSVAPLMLVSLPEGDEYFLSPPKGD